MRQENNCVKNLNNLLKLLLEAKFDFVLVGGFAGMVYGSSLVTRDLDICIACTEDNVKNLRTILNDLHPVHRMTPQKLSFLNYPETLTDIRNLYLNTDLGTIDILSTIIGVGDFDLVKKNATPLKLFENLCYVISIDDLIKTKKAMGRNKDKMAVEELEIIRKKRS